MIARWLERRRHETRYGDGGTIHRAQYLDVEVHRGQVVAVWFRCHPVPFQQSEADEERAADMRRMHNGPPIKAIVFEES